MSPKTKHQAGLSARMQSACSLKQQRQQQETNGGNNNDENYASEYPPAAAEERRSPSNNSGSGSGSGGSSRTGSSPSSESALSLASSTSESCDDDLSIDRNSLTPTSSSGRSSAAAHEAPQLNTVVNIAPATHETRHLVDKIRIRFLDSLQTSEGSETETTDQFDPLDLSELRRELPEDVGGQEQALAFRFITRFINFHRLERLQAPADEPAALDEIVEKLREFLKFRHHYQLSRVLLDDFCKEIYRLHGIFPFGRDKNHLPVMYMRARVHRRWSPRLDDAFRRYVAWQVDLMTKSHAGAQVAKSVGRRESLEKDGSFGICFDCLHVSYSCVDMDFLSYLVKILVHHYPTYCRYALCVDLPWLFRSVWKLVRSWLPEEARNTVQLITAKQLTDFIDPEQIPNCVRVSAGQTPTPGGQHHVPENFATLQSIEQLGARLELSPSEVKHFKAHVDKVAKEYKLAGAI